MTNILYHPASFRDPAGFVFQADEIFYRQVNKSYAANYEIFMQSGLYRDLLGKKMIIAHSEVENNFTQSPDWYKTLQPQQISLISYPYEWCFDQLKDASLLTLEINMAAIEKGMILKDASAFNIQFHKGKPIFIDTLSFEKYDPSKPWVAYRQFCGHFLFPLLLSHYRSFNAIELLSIYIDGFPVEMTASLLPQKTKLKLGTLLHVHLQNKISKNKKPEQPHPLFDQKKMERLLLHLRDIIRKLNRKTGKTDWNNYYDETISGHAYLEEKEKLIHDMLAQTDIHTALDIGSNKGFFARLLAEKKINVIATDKDDSCINQLYKDIRDKGQSNILPLVIDIANPSPGIGLDNMERSSFLNRVHADLVLALAIVHHLVITQNIPFTKLAAGFSALTIKYLIIEYIPPEDEKAKLLIQRNNNYHAYTEQEFENCFGEYFIPIKKEVIPKSSRIIYLFEKKASHQTLKKNSVDCVFSFTCFFPAS